MLLRFGLEAEQRVGLRILVATLGLVELVGGLIEQVEAGLPVVGRRGGRCKRAELAHPVVDKATNAERLGATLTIGILEVAEVRAHLQADLVGLGDEFRLGERASALSVLGRRRITAARREKECGGTQE